MNAAMWFLIGIGTAAIVVAASLFLARLGELNDAESEDEIDSRMDSIRDVLRDECAGVQLVKRRHVRAGDAK
jgi:hypothetical protein